MKNILVLVVVVLLLVVSSKSFAQFDKEKNGAGICIGLVNKVQYSIPISDKSQISIDLGMILFDGDFDIRNLGVTFKCFLSKSDLSTYVGLSGAFLTINDLNFHIYIPMGLQKYVSKDLAIFGGFNPGIILDGGVTLIIGSELGATLYF